MNSCEIYWNVELPDHFVVEHPIGTVLGKAMYGDFFCVYQGVTVGANFEGDDCIWPAIGNNVTMYANSTIIGNCHIGSNVIIAASAFLIDCDVPDNSIVYGVYPNHRVITKTEEEIKRRGIRIWNWDM